MKRLLIFLTSSIALLSGCVTTIPPVWIVDSQQAKQHQLWQTNVDQKQ